MFGKKKKEAPKTNEYRPLRKLKKVAIVGFAEHKRLAPFDDPEFEIWGLNELYDHIPLEKAKKERRLRWFEIHKREAIYDGNPFGSRNNEIKHVDKLNGLGQHCPVYMHKHWDDIATSVTYPLQLMIDEYGGYFTNSISYMIALAIYEGFEEIHIYGVDMAQASEYCVGPETKVLTADLRWIPVAEVQVGQELIGFEEEARKHTELEGTYRQWRKAAVLHADRLIQPCYKLHMADGTILTASADHRWLVNVCNTLKWRETKKLQPVDVYPSHNTKIVKLLNTWEEDKTWGAGYLSAAFDGEGHVSQPKNKDSAAYHLNVGFAQRTNAMSVTVENELIGRRYQYYHSKSPNDSTTKYSISGGKPEALRFMGQVRPRRLLDVFNPDTIGMVRSMANVPVLRAEFIGDAPVIGLKTTTGTFVAEGFASHNSAQRPSCEYFVGLAKGKGIKIYMPPDADLCKVSFLYGYEDDKASALKAKLKSRQAELQKRMNDNNQQLQMGKSLSDQIAGALQDIEYILQSWV